ncbi:MAG: ArsR family transcriptional regulator [Theionarchaea archaeon]|nr:ArsR family transcriptional regulator [Theionarchaea archaeon]MBU7037555.1 ArsR family transcriptional regulator [Theionarchaea archaeon]
MYQKIEQILEQADSALSTAEVAEKTGTKVFEVRKNLLRLAEEGKIESIEKNGVICWQMKEEESEKDKLEKRMHRM